MNVDDSPHGWMEMFLDAALTAAAGGLLLPVAAWILAARHPRAALVAILAPHALAPAALVASVVIW